MPHGNDGEIKINGNSASTYDGSIYAPDGHVAIKGGAHVDDDPNDPDIVVKFGIQVIADTIFVGGTANLDFIYPSSGIPLNSIMLEMAK